MKISLIFTYFLSLLTLITALISTNTSLIPFIDEKSTQSLCDSLKITINHDQGAHDILIAKIDDNIQDSIADDLKKCFGSDNPVVAMDLQKPIKVKTLNKAKLMIIEGSNIDLKIMSKLSHRHYNSAVWNHMANILFISHTSIPSKLAAKILHYTSLAGFINVALMHKVNGKFEINYAESIMSQQDRTKVKTLTGPGQNIFPDKFKNSKRLPINIPVFNQPTIVDIKSDKIISKMTKFVDILEQKMDVTAQYHILDDPYEILNYFKRHQVQLTLNKLKVSLNGPKVLTYEENGFCALVPKPPRLRVADLIFIKPFDRQVWMFFGLTVVACLVIWRLFLNRGTFDSFWLLLFGIFAMFVGQGVQFLRTHRAVLVILLQLIVSMIFVLSNGYQSVITSFMIQPESEHRIKTVKELIESDMRILASDYFVEIVKESEEFKAVKSRVDILNIEPYLKNEKRNDLIVSNINQKSVIILQCELAESFLNAFITANMNYYILPQKIITIYGYLAVGGQNPFKNKFQYLMDLSVEAGLTKAWSLFLERSHHTDEQISYDLLNLRLNDLTQLFKLLIFGCLCGFLAFLVEVFLCDFINRLDLSFYVTKLRNYINELGKLKIKKRITVKNRSSKARKCCKKPKRPKIDNPKVRRIEVQPVASVA